MTTHNVSSATKLTTAQVTKAINSDKRKNNNAAEKRRRTRAHDVAGVIHQKLHLSFGQCVHLLLTYKQNNKAVVAAVQSANKNIDKINAAEKAIHGSVAVQLSNYDFGTFNAKLEQLVDWAS